MHPSKPTGHRPDSGRGAGAALAHAHAASAGVGRGVVCAPPPPHFHRVWPAGSQLQSAAGAAGWRFKAGGAASIRPTHGWRFGLDEDAYDPSMDSPQSPTELELEPAAPRDQRPFLGSPLPPPAPFRPPVAKQNTPAIFFRRPAPQPAAAPAASLIMSPARPRDDPRSGIATVKKDPVEHKTSVLGRSGHGAPLTPRQPVFASPASAPRKPIATAAESKPSTARELESVGAPQRTPAAANSKFGLGLVRKEAGPRATAAVKKEPAESDPSAQALSRSSQGKLSKSRATASTSSPSTAPDVCRKRSEEVHKEASEGPEDVQEESNAGTDDTKWKGLASRGKQFRGVFKWPSRTLWTSGHCGTPTRSTREETARVRDRHIIACQEVDILMKRTERPISDACLNFPRSDYEKEDFVDAIRDGELVIGENSDPYPHILRFMKDVCIREPKSGSQASRKRARKCMPDRLRGVTARAGGKAFEGRFIWRGKEVTTKHRSSREEAARIRDRCIIVCKWLDEKQGRKVRLTDKRMNWPRSEYEGEPFFVALQRGKLNATSNEDVRVVVYRFLRSHGAYPDIPRSEKEDGEDDADPESSESESSAVSTSASRPKKRCKTFRASFTWRGGSFLSPRFSSKKGALRFRDRCIIACQWVDEESNYPAHIPDSKLKFPRAGYEAEPFFAALKRRELEAESEETAKLRRAVQQFIKKWATEADPKEGNVDGESEAEEELEAEDEPEDKEDEEEPEDESGSQPRDPERPFVGLLYRQKMRFPGTVNWHGLKFSTASSDTMEEAARIRDWVILACRWLDRKRSQPECAATMNFPESEYAKERFYRDMHAGKLRAPRGGCPKEGMRAIREFLEERCPTVKWPRIKAPTRECAELDCGREESECSAADSASSDEDSASYSSDSGEEEDDESDSDYEEGESGSDSEGEEETPLFMDMDKRWRALLKCPRFCDCINIHHGQYVAGFRIEGEKVISPHFDTVDAAKRFIDRCFIAWHGPQREDARKYGVTLHFPITEYAKETFYKKLFTGPSAGRPKVGDNKPDWDEDIAASVRETVQFVMDEMGVAETYNPRPKGQRSSRRRTATSTPKIARAAEGTAAGAKRTAGATEEKSAESRMRSAPKACIKGTATAKAPPAAKAFTKKASSVSGRKRASTLSDEDAAPPKQQKARADAAPARAASGKLKTPEAAAGASAGSDQLQAGSKRRKASIDLDQEPEAVVPKRQKPEPSLPAPAPAAAAAAAQIASPPPVGPAPVDDRSPLPQTPAAAHAPALSSAAAASAAPALVPAAAVAVGAPAPPAQPASLLGWRAPAVLDWFRDVFVLEPDDLAYRSLQRLALTGRMLVLRPARSLRPRLLEKQRELCPGAGEAEADALEAVLDALDHEVALLVAKARRGDGSRAEELDALMRARAEAAGQAGAAGP